MAYNQEYDDIMHSKTPIHPDAIEAFRRRLKSFQILADSFNEKYKGENRAIAFLPDQERISIRFQEKEAMEQINLKI